ncbi:unnamed protein product [Effrenium voratum]|nr:unnamed protein product [Effrenium voratum]
MSHDASGPDAQDMQPLASSPAKGQPALTQQENHDESDSEASTSSNVQQPQPGPLMKSSSSYSDSDDDLEALLGNDCAETAGKELDAKQSEKLDGQNPTVPGASQPDLSPSRPWEPSLRLRSRSPLRRRGPNPCWYGASCTRRSCRFVHPARSSHPRPHESRSKARESRSKGGSRRKASRNSKPQWLPPPPPPASGWPAATSERARWGRGEAEWSDRKWGRPEEATGKTPTFRDFVLRYVEDGVAPEDALEAFQDFLASSKEKRRADSSAGKAPEAFIIKVKEYKFQCELCGKHFTSFPGTRKHLMRRHFRLQTEVARRGG